MKNIMFIITLLSLFFFCFSENSFAQQTVGQRMRSNNPANQDWQSLRNNKYAGQYLPQTRGRAPIFQHSRTMPQQRRGITSPRQVYVPRQQPTTVYRTPRTYTAPAQSAYVPMPNFDNATNQVLAQTHQLIADSKRLMQQAQPHVRRRQLEYQHASPQRRMQMDAEKQYMLEKARVNMEGFYNDRWVRSFNPSGSKVYIIED